MGVDLEMEICLLDRKFLMWEFPIEAAFFKHFSSTPRKAGSLRRDDGNGGDDSLNFTPLHPPQSIISAEQTCQLTLHPDL